MLIEKGSLTMKFKIVSDSSSNLMQLDRLPFSSVPLKIVVGETEYIDDAALDLAGMIDHLKKHKGKSGSSCPNVQEWLDAFEDAENIFCVTISKNLSGSYNAAVQACNDYMEEHPDRKAYVFDSLSAGPESAMIIEKTRALIEQGLSFEEIRDGVLDYHNHCHTLFCLQSMTNLARNGRVNPAVAKIATALGIRVAGDAVGGQLNPTLKPRGEKKALQTLMEQMELRGLYNGAEVRIAHCYNSGGALELKEMLQRKYPDCKFTIEHTTGLCSYYAEVGGLIVGYQGKYNTDNLNFEH